MIYLVATIIAAAFLRFYNAVTVALWHDEAFSALYMRYPWGEMIRRIILDVHPPLYYFILRLWTYIFGDSLFALRSLSIVFGIATVYATYLLVKQAFGNKKWAIFAAFLVAINPFQIQFALEARMYTLGTFLLLISCFLLLKAIETNQKKIWIWYGVTAVACMYTHYFLFFSVAAQIAYLIYYLLRTEGFKPSIARSKTFINALWAALVIVVLYLPWIPSFLEQNSRVQEIFWIPALDRWAIPLTLWKMAFGGQGIRHSIQILAVIGTLVFIYYFWIKTEKQTKWLFLSSLIIPFIGAVMLSLRTSIFLDRYFVFASMFLSIIIALCIVQIPKFTWRRTLAIIVIVGTLAAFFKNWQDMGVKDSLFGSSVVRKPGMAKISEIINEQSTKNDKIYVGTSAVYFTFRYYNQTDIKPLLYSTGPLESLPHFSGTALLENEDLIMDFSQTKKNDQVWLIWTTGFGSGKPNVPGNWSLVAEHEVDDAPGFKGKIIVTQYRAN